jgi:hypothetical protein
MPPKTKSARTKTNALHDKRADNQKIGQWRVYDAQGKPDQDHPTQGALRQAMSTTRATKSSAEERRKRLIALVESLPEARAIPAGDRHLSLEVRGKRLGWFLQDHHGDGRLALNLKAARGANQALTAMAPEHFHIPKYIGHHGWVGVWLDSPAPDWREIKKLIEDAYHLTAPKRLVKILPTTTNKEKS